MKTGFYADEKIIQLRAFYQKETKESDILSGKNVIRGRRVSFVPTYLFESKIKIRLPDDFVEMPEKIAKVRYISQFRPPVIMTNRNYDENFGFHLLDAKVSTKIDEDIEQMRRTVALHAPETVFYGQGDFDVKKGKGKWFEYKNFTIDDETYNLQFVIDVHEHLLVGTFNCRMCAFDEWKKPVLQVLESVEFKEKGEWRDAGR